VPVPVFGAGHPTKADVFITPPRPTSIRIFCESDDAVYTVSYSRRDIAK